MFFALQTLFRENAERFRNVLFVSLLLFPALYLCPSQIALAIEPAPTSNLSSSSTITLASTAKKHSIHKARKKNKAEAPLFDLTNLHGQRVTNADLRGKPVLIVFGYTFCPDACPTGLQNLSRLLDLLGDQSAQVHAVFITLDPERDTVDKLKDYLNNFHPSIIGLRGTQEQTAAAAKALHVKFSKAESVGDADYEMDYPAILTVIDANGGLADTLDDEQSPEDLLKALQKYIPPSQ